MNQLGSAGHAVKGAIRPKNDSGHLEAGPDLGGEDSPIAGANRATKTLER